MRGTDVWGMNYQTNDFQKYLEERTLHLFSLISLYDYSLGEGWDTIKLGCPAIVQFVFLSHPYFDCSVLNCNVLFMLYSQNCLHKFDVMLRDYLHHHWWMYLVNIQIRAGIEWKFPFIPQFYERCRYVLPHFWPKFSILWQ